MNPIKVRYNSQRDNKVVRGIVGAAQCGYASVSMMLSKFIPDAMTDVFVAYLVRIMETPGAFKAAILEKVPWARGRVGMYGDAYAAAVRMIVRDRGLSLRVKWVPTGGTVSMLESAIDAGSPAVLSTMITGSGHYITVIGYDDENWICHDPYGDGRRGYSRHKNGAMVKYPRDWLESRAVKSDPNRKGLRFLCLLPK